MSRLLAWQYPSAVHMRTFSVSCTTVSLNNMSLNHFQTISCSFCTFAYVWSAVVPKVVGKLLGPVANAFPSRRPSRTAKGSWRPCCRCAGRACILPDTTPRARVTARARARARARAPRRSKQSRLFFASSVLSVTSFNKFNVEAHVATLQRGNRS